MKAFTELLALVSAAIAAVCWFISASVRLTKVGPGLEELDRVTNLAGDLQRMARWNFWAALSTGITVLLQLAAYALLR
jgi:hypothetical protein